MASTRWRLDGQRALVTGASAGIGLAICREIVIAHRGTITACNNPGGGASLIVTLPQESGNNQ